MKQKFTPGPWDYCAKLSSSENHKGFTVGRIGGWRLADVMPVDSDGNEGEENARLIAAAPELLDACEEAIAVLNGAEISLPDYVVKKLERAIAKATGEQQ